MTHTQAVTYRPHWKRTLWFFVGLGAVGTSLAMVRVAYWGVDVWSCVGLLFVVVGATALHAVTAGVSADAHGLHFRALLRRRSVPWRDVSDLCIRLNHATERRGQDTRRVILVLRDGRKRLLSLPRGRTPGGPGFDEKLGALRALHHHYGSPDSAYLPVVSNRTAGRGWAGAVSLCVLLLVGAGLAAWAVPSFASEEQAFKSAGPCTAETPAEERGECLTTMPAMIERAEANRPKKNSWLYFTENRPQDRLGVSQEAAQNFQANDSVELTFWRGGVVAVAGERYVWRNHMATSGSVAVLAAAFVLAAGYPGARVLLRLRRRRLADDEVVPSALPFAGALVGTALWALPVSYHYPLTLTGSRVAISWVAAGSLATLGLFAWAWRATRVRTPGEAVDIEEDAVVKDVFLVARFLEHTDYNPHGFGTHIVIGEGLPAVTPHPGPGRFAARPIPVERITVGNLRRPRGDDSDDVPRSWHIAELDDAGKPVRLAAAPADLARIIRKLGPAGVPADMTAAEL